MAKCPDCGTEMKPLAYSEYCPNDCDRIVREEIKPEKTPKIFFWEDKDPDPVTFVGPPDPPDIPFITDEELDQLFDDIMIDGTD